MGLMKDIVNYFKVDIDVNSNTEELIEWAAIGNYKEVKRLIPISNPMANGSAALREAVENGHTDIVKLLIPHSNVKADGSHLLQDALKSGQIECAKLLIPASDTIGHSFMVMSRAAYLENKEYVKLLAPHCRHEHVMHAFSSLNMVDEAKDLLPQCEPNELKIAFAVAVDQGHKEMIDILRPHCDIHDVVAGFCASYKINEVKENLHLCEPDFALGAAAHCGFIDEVKELMGHSNAQGLNRALHSAAGEGYADIVNLLMPYCDMDTCGIAVQSASDCENVDCVKLLIPHSDPDRAVMAGAKFNLGEDIKMHLSTCSPDIGLIAAAMCGLADEVNELIPRTDPKINNSEALREAAERGHVECVKALIPVSDPDHYMDAYCSHNALELAAMNGHADCVELLIHVTDVKSEEKNAFLKDYLEESYNDCSVLELAAERGHVDCVKLLMPVSDVESIKEQYRDSQYWKASDLLNTIEQAEIQVQKDRLDSSIELEMEQAPTRKRRM